CRLGGVGAAEERAGVGTRGLQPLSPACHQRSRQDPRRAATTGSVRRSNLTSLHSDQSVT
ncbi:MAG: hypothetical protein QOH62_990, partial [Solirubrobacteraceae bacterium]|nr:hypothetical protein [Solirubrobacteraceae bacterium]